MVSKLDVDIETFDPAGRAGLVGGDRTRASPDRRAVR
jgi:hypothetical protein